MRVELERLYLDYLGNDIMPASVGFDDASQSGADFIEELQKTDNTGFWSVAARLADNPQAALKNARIAAETAISIDPNEPMGHYAMGRIYISDGNLAMVWRPSAK